MDQQASNPKRESKISSRSDSPKWQLPFLTNILLLIVGVIMSLSGLIIQCHYHFRSSGDPLFLALNRAEWNAIHTWTSVTFSVAIVYHVWLHRKWYKGVLTKRLFAKRRTTLVLTLLLTLVLLSGLLPWLIKSVDGNTLLRSSLIEIHDKIAIIFVVVASLHIAKRIKWYFKVMHDKFGRRAV